MTTTTTGQRKACGRCGVVKPVSAFHKSSRSKDGHQSWCKDCAKAANDARKANGHTKPKPQRGYRKQAFDKWLLTGLMEGFVTPDEARRLQG